MGIAAAIMVPHPPLIIPEVGRGEERKIQHTIDAYLAAARFVAEADPEVIVITSPHSVMYADYFHISPGSAAVGNFGQFGAPQVGFSVRYASDFASELASLAKSEDLSAGTMGERDAKLDHATMVPLWFLQKAWGGELRCPIVRIGLSGLPLADHYKLGMLIRQTSEKLGRRTAVVASGDLSHVLKADGPYGYHREGPVYDERIMDVMGRGAFGELFDFDDVFCEKAAECGHRSFVIMAGCFDGVAVKADKLSHEGPFGVGYGVCTFAPQGPDAGRRFLLEYEHNERKKNAALKQSEDAYVKLARKSLEAWVRNGEKIAVPGGLPEELTSRRAGTFVSLKKHGQLRGCIGTIAATADSVAAEIIRNARSAATEDPRFEPVEPRELDDLVYSVDVLGDAEDIDAPDRLDVNRYGVIVTNGMRRGLLLPSLEGVDTVEQQISIAKRKAGIRDDEPVRLQRFEVVRHH